MLDSTKIILLSGRGNRFKDEGYSKPKGLLKIGDTELAILSADSLPLTKNTIFGIQKTDEINYNFSHIINEKYKPQSKIYLFDEYTNGQATSNYEILNSDFYTPINENFFVLACDFSFKVHESKIVKSLNKKYHAIVFTYPAESYNYDNSDSYGWIRADSKNIVRYVSCKKRIQPLQSSDFIITGAFNFLNKDIFFRYYKKMNEQQKFVNNETYIDTMIELMVKDGLNIFNYQVDFFRNFGTPNQYEFEKSK